MLCMRVMYVEGAGGVLSGVGTSPGTWSLKLGGHFVDPRPPFPRHGVGCGGARWQLGHVGLVVAGTALGVQPAPVRGVRQGVAASPLGVPRLGSRGERALAVRGGERGAVVSGDVEEGVKEEVSDALPQGGWLEQGGRVDALGGARGVEEQHPLVSEAPEVLPYCCGVVEGVGLSRCGCWWCDAWRGSWCGLWGVVVLVACGVW